jgi:hypothetical protein
MSLYLGNTEDFIKAYYEECADSGITKMVAYERTEARYYEQQKQWIEAGKLQPTKYANYESFAAALSRWLGRNKRP